MATCKHCGIEFETSWPGRDWCSLEHRDATAPSTQPAKKKAFNAPLLPQIHVNLENVHKAWELYKQYGTLQGAADHWGTSITRERIRQLLNRGTRLGLFEYPPPPPRQFTKTEILDLIKVHGSYQGIARAYGYAVYKISQNAHDVGLTATEYRVAATAAMQARALKRYEAIVKELGAHPNTTYLQQHHRSTAALISRLWGGIENFRSSQGLPSIKRGNPNFFRDVIEPRIARAKARRAKKMADLLVHIVKQGRITTGQAREFLGCAEGTAYSLIMDLMNQKRIERRGSGWDTYYVPVGVDSKAAV